MSGLAIRPAADCRYDALALGEVMLRLDSGEGRMRTAPAAGPGRPPGPARREEAR